MTTLAACIEFDEETGLYVGVVPGVPGPRTQAASLDELRANLREVLELCFEEDEGLRERLAGGIADTPTDRRGPARHHSARM